MTADDGKSSELLRLADHVLALSKEDILHRLRGAGTLAGEDDEEEEEEALPDS